MHLRRALNLLRDTAPKRRQAFIDGLGAAGFRVTDDVFTPAPDDVALLWNRYSQPDQIAKRFEAAGAKVLVAENGYLPPEVIGPGWYAIAEGHHAGAGRWPDLGAERWARLGLEPKPWREDGHEVLILGQRSIGEPGIASPRGWEESVRKQVGGRIRPHPGKYGSGPPLERDLARARCAVTWASSAGLYALLQGIPVFFGMPRWIGAPAARAVTEFERGPVRDDAARLDVFRRMASAMWHLDDIRSGEAFCRLLEH